MPAWLAGKAAAKVGLLRILGLGVAGKVVHSASVLTGPAVVLSKAAYGDWTDTDKSVWDPRKYLPAVFSKNFTVDLASSETTYPCMENTYIKGEGKSPELRINVKDVEIYDSGKSLKLFFTVDAMQKYSRSDPIYYASFPS